MHGYGGVGDIVEHKLAGLGAIAQNALKYAAFAAQALDLELRALLHHHLRQFKHAGLVFQQMERMPHVGEHNLFKALARTAIRAFQHGFHAFNRLQCLAPRNFGGDINFALEKPVNIAR